MHAFPLFSSILSILLATSALAAEPTPAKTLDQLVDEAVAKKQLTEEQGLVYKVKGRFNLGLVPEQYRPSADDQKTDAGLSADGLVGATFARFQSLSPETQSALIPFMIPPAYKGSWMHPLPAESGALSSIHALVDGTHDGGPVPGPGPTLPEGGWHTLDHPRFRVWWHEDGQYDSYSKSTAEAIYKEGGKAIDKLEALMHARALDDSGTYEFHHVSGAVQKWGDGGDGRLDIYVVNLERGVRGLTVSYPPDGCSQKPSFMLLSNVWLGGTDRLLAAFAHEYMHVLILTKQRAGDCVFNNSLDEATATWAMDYVYPDVNYEHDWLDSILYGVPLPWAEYQGWPFFMYLAKVFSPDLIRQIYDTAATEPAFLAVDKTIDGGFEKQLPEYAEYEWNQLPEKTSFKKWDNLPYTPWTADQDHYGAHLWEDIVEAKADDHGEFHQEVRYDRLYPLIRRFIHFDFTKPGVRSIDVWAQLGLIPGTSLRLKAFKKMRGSGKWVVEDWSEDQYERQICQDDKDNAIDELVLSFTNVRVPRDKSDQLWDEFKGYVVGSNLPCKGLKGRLHAVQTRRNGADFRTADVDLDVELQADGLNKHGVFKNAYLLKFLTGQLHYKAQVARDNAICIADQVMQFGTDDTLPNDVIAMNPYLVTGKNGSPAARTYSGMIFGYALKHASIKINYTCGDGKTFTEQIMPPMFSTRCSAGGDPVQHIDASGKLTGKISCPNGNEVNDYEWALEAMTN